MPQFYLRGFASAPERIHLYNFALGRGVPDAKLRRQCYKRHFYGKTDELENALMLAEGAASKVLRHIIDSSILPQDGSAEHITLLFFVILQLLRTSLEAEKLSIAMDRMWKQVLKHDSRTKDFDLNSVRIGSDNPAAIALSSADLMLLSIIDLKAHLFCAAENQLFVTSDVPVVRYNQHYENLNQFGMLGANCRGVQIFIPISPKHLLMLYDSSIYAVGDGKTNVTHAVSDADVATLNFLQAVGADENLYYNDWNISNQVQLLAQKAATYRISDPVDVQELPEIGNEKRSSLLVVRENTPNLRLTLSFVRIFKSARKLSVTDRLAPTYRYRKVFPQLTRSRPNESPLPRTFGLRRNDRK